MVETLIKSGANAGTAVIVSGVEATEMMHKLTVKINDNTYLY